MSALRLPMAIPGEIAELARDVPRDLLNDTFRTACERFDAYVEAIAAELAEGLRLPAETVITPESLVSDRSWRPDGWLALRWLLETLAVCGRAERTDGGWSVTRPGPAHRPAAELRSEAVAALPQTEPTYRVFELCAAALAGVLAGESRGEDALFSPATLGLWFEYFSNENPHYALNNTLAAAALEHAVGPASRILEVGGGGGSAALAALRTLSEAGRSPAGYTFTELHPAFLRRGARAVQAAAPEGCDVSSRRLDIDDDLDSQGLGESGFDAVLAVNTLHLARDLVATLVRLRGRLRPGGALVLGELVRPEPDAGVHIELPFTLLEAYRRTPLIPGIRPRPGFLSADGWERALRAAGFSRVDLLPGAFRRCVDLYPGFYCCALTATS